MVQQRGLLGHDGSPVPATIFAVARVLFNSRRDQHARGRAPAHHQAVPVRLAGHRLRTGPHRRQRAGRYWLPNSPFAPRASAAAAASAAANSLALA